MDPEAVLKEILRRSAGGPGEIRPDYAGLGLANIPASILRLFGVKSERIGLDPNVMELPRANSSTTKVLLLLVDGLGYGMAMRHSNDRGLLRSLTGGDHIRPLTSVFPSTTAAAITTLNSGLTPQEHGLHEWVVYMREIDRTINTLPFGPLDAETPDALLREGADPRMLFDAETVYEQLRRHGIRCFNAAEASIANSAYSKQVHKGSVTVPFSGTRAMAEGLCSILEDGGDPAYCYAYYGNIDGTSHKFGPSSVECADAISHFSAFFQEEVIEAVSRKAAEETILILAADHGQVDVRPEDTTYMSDWPELAELCQTGAGGGPIPPTGSPRDVFLHIKEERTGRAVELIRGKLGDTANVERVSDLAAKGFFGTGKPHREFRARTGNLLVLPEGCRTVWYEHIPGKRFELRGMHGGLSREEMIVPLGVARLSGLR